MIKVSCNYKNLTLVQAHDLLKGKELKKYLLLWNWCTVRIGFKPISTQDKYFKKHGFIPLMNRINRVRKWYGLKPIVME